MVREVRLSRTWQSLSGMSKSGCQWIAGLVWVDIWAPSTLDLVVKGHLILLGNGPGSRLSSSCLPATLTSLFCCETRALRSRDKASRLLRKAIKGWRGCVFYFLKSYGPYGRFGPQDNLKKTQNDLYILRQENCFEKNQIIFIKTGL